MGMKIYRGLKSSPAAPGSTVTTAAVLTGGMFCPAIAYLQAGAQSDHGKLHATVCDWVDNHCNAAKNLSKLDDCIGQSNMRSPGVYAT